MPTSPVLRDENNVLISWKTFLRGSGDLCRFIWEQNKAEWDWSTWITWHCISQWHREFLVQAGASRRYEACHLGVLHIKAERPLTHSCLRLRRLIIAVRFGLCNKCSSETYQRSTVELHLLLPHSYRHASVTLANEHLLYLQSMLKNNNGMC